MKLMVHIGDTEKRYDPKVIRRCSAAENCDILTHYFTPTRAGSSTATGSCAGGEGAVDTGVWFDTAHGRKNFSFDVGRRVIDQGCCPIVSAPISPCRAATDRA